MLAANDRETRILEYHSLVVHIAKRLWSKVPASVELDDLVSVGMLGLIDAADRFDDSLNISFGCYARIRIQGTIVDSLRKQDWVPRVIRNRSKMFAESTRHLASTLGRNPTHGELKEYLRRHGIRDFRSFHKESQIIPLVSTEDSSLETHRRLGDTLTGTNTPADTVVADLELKAQVAAVLNTLNEREQTVIYLYYYDALSLRAIGEFLGVTESRVCQMHRVIRKKLKTALTEKGIEQAA